MIDRERIRAFLDELAMLTLKHGIQIYGGSDTSTGGRPHLGEIMDRFGGYNCDPFCHPLMREPSPTAPITLREFWDGDDTDGWHASSLDVSTATAHQRIALERSLAEVRERAR